MKEKIINYFYDEEEWKEIGSFVENGLKIGIACFLIIMLVGLI